MGCKPCCTRTINNENITVEFNYNTNTFQDQAEEIINSELKIQENKFPKEDIIFSLNIKNYKYSQEILEQINKYRNKHSTPDLSINDEISIISQKYSDKIARENYIELSNNKYNNIDLGEMIFCFNDSISPEKIISSFYEEESFHYNYNNRNPKPSNFTQMIWKNSKFIGIGLSKTKENNIYTVINFYPPGNIKNEFLSNVFPPVEPNYKLTENTEKKIDLLEDLLNRHNEYREKHGVPLLNLNATLTTKAFELAKLMSKNNYVINKEIEYLGEKCGKNVNVKTNDNYDYKGICDEWYREINDYDFDDIKNNNKEKVKNFSQLIWKETKEVGFGEAKNNKGIHYIVGIYFPSGNIENKYKENVFPSVE